MDERRVYYTQWSQSEGEKQISYIKAYTADIEILYWWTYLQGSNGHTERTDLWTQEGRKRVGWREQHGNMNTTICETESQWEFAIWLGELNVVLCNNLERRDRVWGGMEVQEGGDICIPMADSCWYMAETNTIL